MTLSGGRICPDCGSDRVDFVQRGLAGPINATDQYYRCHACGRVTYEIVTRTSRELRAGRIEPGRVIRTAGHSYSVRRILKIGLDEYLVYLRPAEDPFPRLRRQGQGQER
ncbi:hypothetical protein [Sphaerobacter thermophilus]|uniref:Uncharacterized protein n=1 Tax=Sphaerobacter thermophilus (strain ATCC 49802 / DSM 20745 / KCCM 41009 / NCIMB 13125 / S 6022) TaxID=479434 RepID=D1C567_SPHTD|nr:hypothetical protein [Sphaerobacter thermophilus]ACZ39384.1 hypothetical protein Sthe_1952 [Sphaerobacter thermophilus DSM 20745]PZN60800.1 MAG: hypothetical protein DIU58_15120 [Sphaerobacter thermophilus]